MAVPISISDSNGTVFLQSLNTAFDSTIQYIGTIAELRLTVPTVSNMTIAVTGYYTAADNIGVRNYEWDAANTTADNGGTIIAVTGVATGRWVMKYDGAVNVKWFGAKCDGLADDTTAIQNAKNTGKSVYFPAGTYKNTLSIQLITGQELYGDGKNSLISMSVDNNGHVLGIIGATGNPVSDCHIHDIAINCNSTVNLNAVGIAYAENNIVNNVWVYNAGRKAFTLQYEVFNNIVTDCYADGGASTFPMISLEDPTDNGKCSENIITNISLGACADYVLSMDGASENIISNITCASSLRGISLSKSDYNSINNIFTSCTNAFISLNDANNNKITKIKNGGVSSVNIFAFSTAISSDNEFDQITASGSNTIIPYGNLSVRNKWTRCVLSTTYATAQAIGFAISSVGNKIDYCAISNAGNRVMILDSANNVISNNSIAAPTTAIQIGAVDGTMIRNNTISGATASFAIEGTTHTNTMLIGNTKVNGTVQVAVDTVQINNSWNPKFMYNTAAPLAGTFKVGDTTYNTAPAAGGFIGWVCTTAGTPGTWKTFGAITA